MSLVCVAGLAAGGGCQQWERVTDSLTSVKAENPVVAAPPPRRTATSSDRDEPGGRFALAEDSRDTVVPVAGLGRDLNALDGELFGSQTVALVNGTPILASDVLERYGPQLAAAGEKLSPEQLREARLALIRRDLNSHIERTLLAQALRATIPPDRVEQLGEFIDKVFAEEIERLKKEAGVNTTLELERELAKQHTSLAALKSGFATQRMAMEYLASKSKVEIRIGRQELLDYYDAHKDEKYFQPGRVKWQQILISYNKHGGKEGCYPVLKQAIEELRRGDDFTAVAGRHSDGPRAADGGRWDWTQRGSLADKEVEQALFELPVGQVSTYLEGESAFQIVKVSDRTPDRYTPFEEVQDEIRTKLEEEARQQAAKKVIDELEQTAVVVTIFDEPAGT
ncbi:MAG: peptidyl-prolyl cis-trans isomerase [Planctomycetes bacterium]|nr:peptidyl-prolyl cis-trans isomerase [Planctomycetota bacterium]